MHARTPAATAVLLALAGLGAAAVSTPVAQAAPKASAYRWERSAPNFGSRADRVVYAHRGASACRPEHTLAAYRVAIEQGADVIEPDLVATKDGQLVVRHENEISSTTDVERRPEFAARRTTKTIDGVTSTGWFTEDFTLKELRTLRAKERIPAFRPQNTKYDGRYQVPTFQEVVDVARKASSRRRTIALTPEIKHSTYFRSVGINEEALLRRALRKNDLDSRKAPVIVQSFETKNLKELSRTTRVPLVQLLSADGEVPDGTTTYEKLKTASGLRGIAKYADAVSPEKEMILPRSANGRSKKPTSFVRDAHRAGLPVVAYTFRPENGFLPLEFRKGDSGTAAGDLRGEITRFLELGVDAVFSDDPAAAVKAVRAFKKAART